MKILLDACVWGGVLKVLAQAGHDVVWAGDWDWDPGDEEILAKANSERRVLVTLDKDFGELAIARNQPHAGILRLVNLRAERQGPICLQILEHYGSELDDSAIITVEPGRVRIRRRDPA